jgi:hypothetical protein
LSLPPAGNPKKRRIVKKKIGPKKKLAYELIDEELKEHICQVVKDHFKPTLREEGANRSSTGIKALRLLKRRR